MVLGMAGDEIIKKGLIILEDLPNSADKFKQKRRKFSTLQKLMVDEFEMYKGLQRIFNGLFLMMVHFEREGLIVNPVSNENVEQQVYENRFGIFSAVQFPRYRPFEEFQVERAQALNMDPKLLLESVKNSIMEGKNHL
jgi:hypothetical protein